MYAVKKNSLMWIYVPAVHPQIIKFKTNYTEQKCFIFSSSLELFLLLLPIKRLPKVFFSVLNLDNIFAFMTD